MNPSEISGYHAHVYFTARTSGRAREICEQAHQKFGVAMGRMHDKPIGPHPCGSCQLSATPEEFAQLLPWLALNRDGLVVFSHPITGEDKAAALRDHRDHGIWLGCGLELNLTMFQE